MDPQDLVDLLVLPVLVARDPLDPQARQDRVVHRGPADHQGLLAQQVLRDHQVQVALRGLVPPVLPDLVDRPDLLVLVELVLQVPVVLQVQPEQEQQAQQGLQDQVGRQE